MWAELIYGKSVQYSNAYIQYIYKDGDKYKYVNK